MQSASKLITPAGTKCFSGNPHPKAGWSIPAPLCLERNQRDERLPTAQLKSVSIATERVLDEAKLDSQEMFWALLYSFKVKHTVLQKAESSFPVVNFDRTTHFALIWILKTLFTLISPTWASGTLKFLVGFSVVNTDIFVTILLRIQESLGKYQRKACE